MAKNSLLNINFIENNSEIDITEFFKLVGDRVDQWSSLVVQSSRFDSALAVLQTQKPPKLKKLHIIASYITSRQEEIVLFGRDLAAGLKDFRLTNVPIHLTPLHLTGLKALHLEGIRSATAAEVLSLITQSPALEILHLADLEDALPLTKPITGHPDLASNPPIQLTCLMELHLSALPLPFINLLLSIIIAPQMHHFHVSCNVIGSPAAQFLAVGIQHQLPLLHSIAVISQAYEIVLSSDRAYMIRIGELTITINQLSSGNFMDHFQETYDWLSNHTEIELADLPLHLKLADCDPEPSYLEWFTHRTNVTKLTLYTSPLFGTDLHRIIPFLGRPTSPSPASPAPTWLLPQMEIIVAEDTFDIVDMIEKRHSASQISLVGREGQLPKRFREIWLKAPYDPCGDEESPSMEGYLLEVVRVAGEADVYWEGTKIQRK
ncbi:hypothetical protein FS837_004383 [Tulasnella sp. UAMH 9824]|nr:hypothetical protein FS837_004383 [Tulasnella sp. UAMH 9824]